MAATYIHRIIKFTDYTKIGYKANTDEDSYLLNIIVKPARKDVRKNFFSNSTRHRNDLPTDMKNANTVTQLKTRLNKHS